MSVPINWSAMPSWAVDAMVTNDYRGVILTNGDKRYCPIDEPEEFSTPYKDYDGVMSKSPIVSVREVKMSEAKFTKGEWIVNDCGDVVVKGSGASVGYPPQKGVIASLCDGEYIENYNKHDPHLIAAAPEMYEMLLHLNEIFNHEQKSVTIIDADRVSALLAKARGEV